MTPPMTSSRRTPPPEFGPALAAGRAAAGLSLREAARRCGVSHGYLSLLEAGQRSPSRSVARNLVDCLDLDVTARAVIEGAALSDAGYDHPNKARKRQRLQEAGRPIRLDSAKARSEQRQLAVRLGLDLAAPPVDWQGRVGSRLLGRKPT